MCCKVILSIVAIFITVVVIIYLFKKIAEVLDSLFHKSDKPDKNNV